MFEEHSRTSRRGFIGGGLAAIMAGNASAQCAPIDLGIQNIPQEMPNWCWVAAAQQIIFWATGDAPPQCAMAGMANNVQPQYACAAPGQMNVPGYMQQIAALISRFVGAHSMMGGPGTAEQVYETIYYNRPIIMLVNPGFSQVGHFVVIRAVSCGSGELLIHLNDPLNFPGFSTTVTYGQIARMWTAALVVG